MLQEEKISKILELSQKNFTNKELASYLNMKFSTVCKYKRILRDRGFYVEAKSGRPKIKLGV